MPLTLIRADIMQLKRDAIVCPSDANLSGSGSIDYCVQEKAGILLKEQLKQKTPLECGQAAVFDGCESGFKKLIFTYGPIYNSKINQDRLLYNCYKNCLNLAFEQKCQSIAFPLISSGTFGYPKRDAYRIATAAIRAFLLKEDMDVTLVLYDDESYQIASSIEKDIPVLPVENNRIRSISTLGQPCLGMATSVKEEDLLCNVCESDEVYQLDESFQRMLFRLIDNSGMSDVEVYKKANLDKRLFSKIRSNENYHPKKETVLALAIALKLNHQQCEELLNRAGYSLSRSLMMDVIVRSFISRKVYDIDEINIVLLEHDQKLLGSQ